MFTKSNLKFIIDALMFLCMMAIGGLGFLMKFILLSGQEAQLKYGSKVEVYFLGLNKHDWGEIHLYIAFGLGALLLLHIILNWTQVLHMFHRFIEVNIARKIITVVFIVVSIILLLFAFVIEPDVRQKEGGGGGQHSNSNSIYLQTLV